jgi:hypothetical protein
MRRTVLAAPARGTRPSLRRLVPVAALGAALALSACQTQSPIQTNVMYDPADGVPVDLGSVQLRDLVVVGSGKDKPGVLSASVSNTGSQAERIAFALPNAAPVYATAPAHSEQRLSGTSQVQLPAVPAAPGDVVTLTVQSPNAPAAVVVVPVVPASHYYATMAPTAVPVTTTTATP